MTLTRVRVGGLALMTLMVVGGGAGLSAASEPPANGLEFVAIAPCRLMDTRPLPDNVGDRSSPMGPHEVVTERVTGTVGHCNVPVKARGVAMNITALNGTADSYLSV